MHHLFIVLMLHLVLILPLFLDFFFFNFAFVVNLFSLHDFSFSYFISHQSRAKINFCLLLFIRWCFELIEIVVWKM